MDKRSLKVNLNRKLTKFLRNITVLVEGHLDRPQLNLQTLPKHDRETFESHYQDWKDKKITGVQFADMPQLRNRKGFPIARLVRY